MWLSSITPAQRSANRSHSGLQFLSNTVITCQLVKVILSRFFFFEVLLLTGRFYHSQVNIGDQSYKNMANLAKSLSNKIELFLSDQ